MGNTRGGEAGKKMRQIRKIASGKKQNTRYRPGSANDYTGYCIVGDIQQRKKGATRFVNLALSTGSSFYSPMTELRKQIRDALNPEKNRRPRPVEQSGKVGAPTTRVRAVITKESERGVLLSLYGVSTWWPKSKMIDNEDGTVSLHTQFFLKKPWVRKAIEAHRERIKTLKREK